MPRLFFSLITASFTAIAIVFQWGIVQALTCDFKSKPYPDGTPLNFGLYMTASISLSDSLPSDYSGVIFSEDSFAIDTKLLDWSITSGEYTLSSHDPAVYDYLIYLRLSYGRVYQWVLWAATSELSLCSEIQPWHYYDLVVNTARHGQNVASGYSYYGYGFEYQMENGLEPPTWGADLWTSSVTTSPVPEPSTTLLIGIGVVGLAVVGRRKRR
ncbi:MAG: PEP-CTERM sorting domain-containing protein [Chlorobium sp.]|nr:PEP-CTERM sorting domain-containing protein [Chlorobium sp.]